MLIPAMEEMMARIREVHLIVPALEVLATSEGHFCTTTRLIEELEALFRPEGQDADILDGRHDTYFSQKVRNLVSHRGAATGLEARGLATYDPERKGFQLTDEGMKVVIAVYG